MRDKGTTKYAICDILACPNYNGNHVQHCDTLDPIVCEVKRQMDTLTAERDELAQQLAVMSGALDMACGDLHGHIWAHTTRGKTILAPDGLVDEYISKSQQHIGGGE